MGTRCVSVCPCVTRSPQTLQLKTTHICHLSLCGQWSGTTSWGPRPTGCHQVVAGLEAELGQSSPPRSLRVLATIRPSNCRTDGFIFSLAFVQRLHSGARGHRRSQVRGVAQPGCCVPAAKETAAPARRGHNRTWCGPAHTLSHGHSIALIL